MIYRQHGYFDLAIINTREPLEDWGYYMWRSVGKLTADLRPIILGISIFGLLKS
jgi:hypothetical protein